MADAVLAAPQERGDRTDALARLHHEHGADLLRLCRRRLSDPHLAEDACHETLLRAAANLERVHAGAALWPWLATIAANVCIDMQRRAARVSVVAEPPVATAAEEPHDSMTREQRRRLVEDALASLPEPVRSSLYLRELAGWSYAEIASVQGCSTGAVRSTLFRGRRMLRSRVEMLAAARREWPLPAAMVLGWRAGPGRIGRLRDRLEAARTRVALRLDPTMLVHGELFSREALAQASMGVALAVGVSVPALIGSLTGPVPSAGASPAVAADALDHGGTSDLSSPVVVATARSQEQPGALTAASTASPSALSTQRDDDPAAPDADAPALAAPDAPAIPEAPAPPDPPPAPSAPTAPAPELPAEVPTAPDDPADLLEPVGPADVDPESTLTSLAGETAALPGV
jgi:RNA polymerase sigma-70 factor (ECF subfamily)